MSEDFSICEALLWEPATGFFLLDSHLQRLERSAARFGFPLDPKAIRERLLDFGQRLVERPRKVRIELAANGAITLGDEDVKPSTPITAALGKEPVQSNDEFLRHKTTRRAVYHRALAAHPEAQDVLLWNERGELTETCHGNLVLEIEGRRLTPPLSSGLLPGVFRGYLLHRGEIQEHLLLVGALDKASAIFMINSVRKWCEIRLNLAESKVDETASRRWEES